jgi:hypothetical protein
MLAVLQRGNCRLAQVPYNLDDAHVSFIAAGFEPCSKTAQLRLFYQNNPAF